MKKITLSMAIVWLLFVCYQSQAQEMAPIKEWSQQEIEMNKAESELDRSMEEINRVFSKKEKAGLLKIERVKYKSLEDMWDAWDKFAATLSRRAKLGVSCGV